MHSKLHTCIMSFLCILNTLQFSHHDFFTVCCNFVNLNESIMCLFQGEAQGDLYVDDYHTHEYRRGQFIHRQFTYTAGQLSSK